MIKYLLIFIVWTSSLEALKLHKKTTNFNDVPKFKTLYIDQYLDHFNKRDDRTYKQRYLINGNKKCLLFNFYFNLIR